MIVCADADMDTAVDCAARGAFSSAGQLCLSIERIYVVGERYGEFVDRLVSAGRALPAHDDDCTRRAAGSAHALSSRLRLTASYVPHRTAAADPVD